MSLKWVGIRQRESPQPPLVYQYQPLQDGHIRVLRLFPLGRRDSASADTDIQCELVHVRLKEPLDYEALSYVWGTPELTHTITMKALGQQEKYQILRITKSLWVALRHLRYKNESRFLWVDQICINQQDTFEKNSQVGFMGEIYSRATCSVVWLGPKGPDAAPLEEMYTELSKSLPGGDNMGLDGVPILDQQRQALVALLGSSSWDEKNYKIFKRREILQQFLNLPWFTRAWVYQEAVTAPKVDMAWGTIVIPFDFITGLVVSAYAIAKGSDDRRWHRRIKSTTGFAPLRAMFHDRIKHRDGELNFLNVLWHARKHLAAGNHRDYVYAFLAVNKYTVKDRSHPSNTRLNNSLLLQDNIIPNYGASVEQVYTHLALTAIHTTRTLDILQYVVPTKKVLGNYSLPSWVPNWADRKFVCGSPIFVPGVPWKTSESLISTVEGSSWNPLTTTSPLHLPTSGFTLGCVETVVKHSFKHTYFSSTLKNALRLNELTTLIDSFQTPPPSNLLKFLPNSSSSPRLITRATILETILANGSFTPSHSITPFTTPQLLAAYDAEKETIPAPGEDDEGEAIRNWLRQSAEVATGKRIFLLGTERTSIGMGFSTVKAGDLVVVLFGCKAPVILRRESIPHDGTAVGEGGGIEAKEAKYKVVGLCFVHGCMDDVVTALRWRGKTLERFVLV